MGPRMDLDGLADGLLTVIDRLMPVKRAGVVFVQGRARRQLEAVDRLRPQRVGRLLQRDASRKPSACCGPRVARRWTPSTHRHDCGWRLRRAQIHHLYPIGGHNELRGVVFIGEKLSEAAYTADDFAFLGVIAGQAALLVENAFLYENLAAQERVRQELAIARRIQLESLPQRPHRRSHGLDVYGVSVPAQEVGGDYFDYLEGQHGRPGR